MGNHLARRSAICPQQSRIECLLSYKYITLPYFVGYTPIKEYAWSALEPGQKIDVLSIPALEGEAREVTALLPSDEPNNFEESYGREAKSHGKLFAGATTTTSYEDADVGF
jgi:hypothetical protein